MRTIRAAALAGLAALLLGGCSAKPDYLRKPYSAPPRIAVLPFSNQTNNIEAPALLQILARQGLERGGYAVVPAAEVEAKLKDIGITDGGQLPSKKPEELAAALGASALFYGEVRDFSYVTLGVYQKRSVVLAGSILEADGTPEWRHVSTARRSEINLEAARNLGEFGKSLGWQLAGKWVEKLVAHPLYPEMVRCVHDLYMVLPRAGSTRPIGTLLPRGYDVTGDFWRDVFTDLK